MAKKKVYKNYLQREQEKVEKRKAKRRNEMGKPQKQRRDVIAEKEKMFGDLLNMSDAEIAARLDEIMTRRDNIDKEIMGRYRDREEDERFEELLKEDKKLEKEQRMLEDFPMVKDQIEKIISYRDRLSDKKSKSIGKLDREVQDMEQSRAELKEKIAAQDELRKRQEKVELEIDKIDEYTEGLAAKDLKELSKEQKRIQEKAKRRDELLAEKKDIEGKIDLEDLVTKKAELKELEEKIKRNKKQLDTYKMGKSKEDSAINKCNMAWTMLLAGKSWDEINIAAIEDVKRRKEQADREKVDQDNGRSSNGKADQANGRDSGARPNQGSLRPVDFGTVRQGVAADIGKLDEEKESDKGKLPVEIEKFADRHPRIAGIPLIGKWIAKVADDKAIRKEEALRELDEVEMPDNSIRKERDSFMEYLREKVTEDRHTERGEDTGRTVEIESGEHEPMDSEPDGPEGR